MLKNRKIVTVDTFHIVATGKFSSSDLGEGRIIPGIVVDAENNKTLIDLINIHNDIQAGDAQYSWAFPTSLFNRSVFLHIEFLNPMKLTFAVEFQPSKHFETIDGIIYSRALCLSIGKPGDSFSGRFSQSINLEIPKLDFDAKWEILLDKTLAKKYNHFKKSEKKIAISQHKKSMRELWKFRKS